MLRISSTAKVAIIGSAALDIIFDGPRRWPASGETVTADRYSISVGGTGLNAALWLCALRGIHSVELFSRIGDDTAGKLILATLSESMPGAPGHSRARLYATNIVSQANANTRFVFVRSIPSAPRTEEGAFFDSVDAGDRSMISVGGAASDIGEEDVCRASQWLSKEDVLFISGVGTLPMLGTDACIEQVRSLHDRGVVIAIDLLLTGFAEYDRLSTAQTHIPADVCAVAQAADIIMCNLPEAEVLSGVGEDVVKAARRISEQFNGKAVAVKLQDRGTFLYAPDVVAAECGLSAGGEMVATHVREVVDSTGAGDAWCAGFLRGLIHTRGNDLRLSAQIGNHVAGLCISSVGAASVPPSLNWAQVLNDVKNGRES